METTQTPSYSPSDEAVLSIPAASSGESTTLNIYLPQTHQSETDSTDLWSVSISSVASVLANAAWPIGIVIIALIFKKQIKSLIDRMRTFKAPGGFEISLEDLIEELPEPLHQNSEAEPTARLSPIDTIVSSWVEIERAINRLYARCDKEFSGKQPSKSRSILSFLFETGVISEELRHKIAILREIRNRIVHEPDQLISDDIARNYFVNAVHVINTIDSLENGEAK